MPKMSERGENISTLKWEMPSAFFTMENTDAAKNHEAMMTSEKNSLDSFFDFLFSYFPLSP